MGKGEIAHYEQFLLFPQCFQKACFQGASKGVIVWEWVNGYRQSTETLVSSLSKLHSIFLVYLSSATALSMYKSEILLLG